MRVFIDTNILIDFVVNREGFSEDATQNAQLCELREIVL